MVEQIKATLKDHMGSDLTVVNAARVSFGKESDWEGEKYSVEVDYGPYDPKFPLAKTGIHKRLLFKSKKLSDRDAKLIRYLAKHKHLSPFGHCFASFHVKAPIFVARQLVKHKFLRWNEVSRRYVDGEPEFYVPDVWRGRSADKKQGSEGSVKLPTFIYENTYEGNFGDLEGVLWDMGDVNQCLLDTYDNLLANGVAPEQARMVLPQSTMTEWWWSGSLDAFASMCKLRCAPDTQYESRLVADQISKVMGEIFPVSWEALMNAEH